MKKSLFAVIAVLLLTITPFPTSDFASDEPLIETRGKTGIDQS